MGGEGGSRAAPTARALGARAGLPAALPSGLPLPLPPHHSSHQPTRTHPRTPPQVLMATNRIDILDPALLRPGRIDRKIEFPHPDEGSRCDILRIHSRKMNLQVRRRRRWRAAVAAAEPRRGWRGWCWCWRRAGLWGRLRAPLNCPASPAATLNLPTSHLPPTHTPAQRGIDLKKIGEGMTGASGAELKAVCTEAGMFALRERRVHVTQVRGGGAQPSVRRCWCSMRSRVGGWRGRRRARPPPHPARCPLSPHPCHAAGGL